MSSFDSVNAKPEKTTSIPVLIISWIMAVVCIIVGATSLSPKSGGQSNNTISVNYNEMKSVSVKPNTTYTVTFYASNTGTHTLLIDDATLTAVKNPSGSSVSYSRSSSSSYDYAYTFRVSSTGTYKLTISTQSSSYIYIKIQ